jgi:hypothetical protein
MAHFDLNQRYEFTGNAKRWSLIMIVIGVIAIAFGLFTHAERTFANLLLNSYYMTCVCLAGLFFVAIQFVANAGWATALVRIPSAFSKVLPWAGLILIIVIVAGLFTHNLYHHWSDPDLINPSSPKYDKLIEGKSGYLNIPFFLTRLVGFLIIWTLFMLALRKYTKNEDEVGGLLNYNKSIKTSAIFLVVFGFSSAIFAFDVIMSLEAHWFSTMFAWYNFAALWVSGLSAITLTLILLKEKGHYSWVNDSHLHDLGKFIFAFSIFWTYVWFSQFVLIYYANLPEEVVYFKKRWVDEYWWLFLLNIIINFVAPVLILMTRDAKRNFKLMKWLCVIVLAGHWLDYYMMIMPGTVGTERGFGIIEIGTTIGFIGLFAYLMLSALSKAALVPKNHPFLEESLHHEI